MKDSSATIRPVFALAYRWNDDEIAEEALGVSFDEGARLFNAGEYYACHDVLESLWNNALDPQRSILHGILQCSVGLYHLLHQVYISFIQYLYVPTESRFVAVFLAKLLKFPTDCKVVKPGLLFKQIIEFALVILTAYGEDVGWSICML